MAEPAARFYESQGLRLHYADWGNETAPPLILIHGGLDHCRNWDAIARELQPHFHVVAPDLRGHGDSEWAKGSSYSLSDNVYDLARLMRFAEVRMLRSSAIRWAGWSRWPMPGPIRTGCRASSCSTVPSCRVRNLRRSPNRCRDGSTSSTRISAHEPSAFKTIEEAAQRLSARNKRLTSELALHLARHGVRQDTDGLYRWKFDHYQRARAPYRLSPDDYVALWSRIACPTLLMWGSESFLPDPEAAGLLAHFKQAELKSSTAPDTGFIMTGSMRCWRRCDGFSDVAASARRDVRLAVDNGITGL